MAGAGVAGARAQPIRPREAALQARWAAGEWRGQTLRATTGEAYQVLYQGRPGGGAGPDFRDAVLLRVDGGADGAERPSEQAGERVYGDIELHLRPSGWRAHGHAGDPRYNGLALHVVLDARSERSDRDADALAPTRLASGGRAPLVVLRSPSQPGRHANPSAPTPPQWPCADLATRLSSTERHALLVTAGQARFEQRVARFAAELRAAPIAPADATHSSRHTAPSYEPAPARGALSNLWPNRRQSPPAIAPSAMPSISSLQTDQAHPGWSAADHILWLALAEALGYGRDRAMLRAWGARLAPHAALGADGADSAQTSAMPAAPNLPRVERLRLRGLFAWRERWANSGPWAPIHRALAPRGATWAAGGACAASVIRDASGESGDGDESKDAAAAQRAAGQAARRLLAALRVGGGDISPGRAVILAANVALPFAAAWAARTGNDALATLARYTYATLPGAPSNQITREMVCQLGLPRAPAGAATQQGLHHLWASHCREKRCDGCPCGSASGRDLLSASRVGDVWAVGAAGTAAPDQPYVVVRSHGTIKKYGGVEHSSK